MFDFFNSNNPFGTIVEKSADKLTVSVEFASNGTSTTVAIDPNGTIGDVVAQACKNLGLVSNNNFNISTDVNPAQAALASVKSNSISRDGQTITNIVVSAGKLNSNNYGTV